MPTWPKHLSRNARRWLDATAKQFQLGAHHRELLVSAAEAWDRAETARQLVAKDGIVVADRWGQAKPHPAVVIERDSRGLFARTLAAVGLDHARIGDPADAADDWGDR